MRVRMETMLKPTPVEEAGHDGKAPEVGERHPAGAARQPDTVLAAEHRPWPPPPPARLLPPRALLVVAVSAGEEDTTTRAAWIVRWRGLDEEFASAADAIDRQEQLEARGIETEMFEVVAGRRRRLAEP